MRFPFTSVHGQHTRLLLGRIFRAAKFCTWLENTLGAPTLIGFAEPMRRPVVIIFARAPRLGAVKRRLAAGIGARGALRFYRAMLAATAWPIARDRRWHTVLAITPAGARADWGRLAPPGTPRMPQASGDLGRRMEKALAPFPRAILIGSDIPGLGPADIAAGFCALGRADAAFGPALDGGYWLVGFGPRRPQRPFAKVRWSGPHALADTMANFRNHRVALLPPKRDVDSADDLAALGMSHQLRP
jgi:rSAM/selenodomain-associated transferase 1